MKKKTNVKNIDEYKKSKKNRYKKRKLKKIAKTIFISFSILLIIIINLCGNAIVSNYKYKMNTLEKKLRKEEIALDEVKMKNIKNTNITNIEKEAKEQLKMDYPNNNQIRYIDTTD